MNQYYKKLMDHGSLSKTVDNIQNHFPIGTMCMVRHCGGSIRFIDRNRTETGSWGGQVPVQERIEDGSIFIVMGYDELWWAEVLTKNGPRTINVDAFIHINLKIL